MHIRKEGTFLNFALLFHESALLRVTGLEDRFRFEEHVA
jgi:hypothetical protein